MSIRTRLRRLERRLARPTKGPDTDQQLQDPDFRAKVAARHADFRANLAHRWAEDEARDPKTGKINPTAYREAYRRHGATIDQGSGTRIRRMLAGATAPQHTGDPITWQD